MVYKIEHKTTIIYLKTKWIVYSIIMMYVNI